MDEPKGGAGGHIGHNPSYDPRYVYTPPAREAYPGAKRAPSRFWLFVCSCTLPGVGYMYLGLIKKGVFFLCAFFLAAFLAATVSEYFLLAVPVMYVTLFFDCFRIRRLMERGINTEDSVDGVIGFVKKYRAQLVLLFALLLACGVVNEVLDTIESRYWMNYSYSETASEVTVTVADYEGWDEFDEIATTTITIEGVE